MIYIFPYYTAIYAAVLGLLAALLTTNVIVNRVRAKVDVADGGVAPLAQAIRAHGNFAEHTPLALLLIGLVEAFAYRSPIVIGLGAALLADAAFERLGPQFNAQTIVRAAIRRNAHDPGDRRFGGVDHLRRGPALMRGD